MSEDWKPIELSARAFGHLSQGLYRTPAGAIKELISNAFDADSPLVRIHTDFPRFMTFSCEDFGTGMPLNEFERLVHKGIGDSLKRNANSADRDRPNIGRLGLGILALAIICTQFEIESHDKESKTAFKGAIRFSPYTREEMDRLAREAEDKRKNTKSKASRNHRADEDGHENDPNAIIAGGSYVSKAIAYDPKRPAVRIFTSHLRDAFKKIMCDLEKYGNRTVSRSGASLEPYPTFDAFLDRVYAHGHDAVPSLNLLSEYDQLLFGLALSPPLPLIPDRNIAIALPQIKKRQQTLEGYKFALEVDNLKIYNPVCLPSNRAGTTVLSCRPDNAVTQEFEMKDGATTETRTMFRRSIGVKDSDLSFNLYDFNYSGRVGGRPLRFSGYLFQQTGRLYPRDIQGVLVRINNVAIGKYDNSLMTYPHAEGPRFSMVTSELFIEEGFEDALNVDRDSFNELHPHYIRVQAYLHALLHECIFPVTWTEEKNRNRGRREKVAVGQQTKFSRSFESNTGSSLGRIRRVEVANPVRSKNAIRESPVDFVKNAVQIDSTHPVLHALRKRKKMTPVIERIVIAFERANFETTTAKRRELFYKMLIDIFGES